MHPRGEAQRFDRLEQEFIQFGGSLTIAPIADPHEVAAARDPGMRVKDIEVSRLMPGEDLPSPAARDIRLAQHLAECEHAVEAVEIEGTDRIGIGDHAMVGIVEQKRIATGLLAVASDSPDELRLIPFMDN